MSGTDELLDALYAQLEDAPADSALAADVRKVLDRHAPPATDDAAEHPNRDFMAAVAHRYEAEFSAGEPAEWVLRDMVADLCHVLAPHVSNANGQASHDQTHVLMRKVLDKAVNDWREEVAP